MWGGSVTKINRLMPWGCSSAAVNSAFSLVVVEQGSPSMAVVDTPAAANSLPISGASPRPLANTRGARCCRHRSAATCTRLGESLPATQDHNGICGLAPVVGNQQR
jgi:hypothetical protein